MGNIRLSIPGKNLRYPYPVCKKFDMQQLHIIARGCVIFMSPQPKGGVTYCFWRVSRLRWRQRPRSFVSVRYLLKQLMYFDQTCTDTYIVGRA